MNATREHLGPGISKVRVPCPFSERVLRLTRSADPLWSLWFERLDVVSEGVVGLESTGSVYRGTTSLIVLTDQHGGNLPTVHLGIASRVARSDPHFWLRALRVARREAVSRCVGPLGCVKLEMEVRDDQRGIRADIDVEARVLVGVTSVKVNGL